MTEMVKIATKAVIRDQKLKVRFKICECEQELNLATENYRKAFQFRSGGAAHPATKGCVSLTVLTTCLSS